MDLPQFHTHTEVDNKARFSPSRLYRNSTRGLFVGGTMVNAFTRVRRSFTSHPSQQTSTETQNDPTFFWKRSSNKRISWVVGWFSWGNVSSRKHINYVQTVYHPHMRRHSLAIALTPLENGCGEGRYNVLDGHVANLQFQRRQLGRMIGMTITV